MGGAVRTKIVTLDHTRETLPLGGAGHIDLLAHLENFHGNGAADLEIAERIGSDGKFFQDCPCFDTCLCKVTSLRFCNARCTALAKGHLHGRIAVVVGGLDLSDAIVRHVQHRNRDGCAVVSKDASHANLPADETKTHLSFLSNLPSYRCLAFGCQLQLAGRSIDC